MKNRSILSIVLALIMLLSTGAAFASEEPIEIVYNCIWVADYDSPPQYARKVLFEDFAKTHPNVTIKDNSISYEDHMVKLNQWIATGDLPDVFMCRTVDLKQMVENGQIKDYQTYFDMKPGWKEKFIPDAFGDLTIDGVIYAAPYQYMSTAFLYCNNEIFEKAGAKIPVTVDDFFDACEKIKAIGVTPFGFGQKESTLLGDVFWIPICYSYTGTEWLENMLVNRGTGLKWADNEKFIDSLRFMETMGKNGYINADCNALLESDAYILFYQEECAMTSFGGWFGEVLETWDLDFCNKVTLTYEPNAGATPANTINAGATWGWAIRGDIEGEKLQACVDFVEMLTDERYTQAALDQGFVRLPCAIPEDADLSKVPVLSMQTYELTKNSVGARDYYSAFMDSDLQVAFGEALQMLSVGEMTAEEACEYIQVVYDDVY